MVILSLVGRRALAAGPPDRIGRLWFVGVGMSNGTATFLLYAALGPGLDRRGGAAGRRLPADRRGAELSLLRDERLHAIGLLGIVVSVAGVDLAAGGNLTRGGKAAEWAPEFLQCAGNARGTAA